MMFGSTIPVSPLLVAVPFVAFVIYRLSRVGKREHFLPPGPPTIPLLGNLHVFPKLLAYHQLIFILISSLMVSNC